MNRDDFLSLLGIMPTKTSLIFNVIEEVDCGRQIYPGKHVFSEEMRFRAYKFSDYHLN
jgi:hypothetical protein